MDIKKEPNVKCLVLMKDGMRIASSKQNYVQGKNIDMLAGYIDALIATSNVLHHKAPTEIDYGTYKVYIRQFAENPRLVAWTMVEKGSRKQALEILDGLAESAMRHI